MDKKKKAVQVVSALIGLSTYDVVLTFARAHISKEAMPPWFFTRMDDADKKLQACFDHCRDVFGKKVSARGTKRISEFLTYLNDNFKNMLADGVEYQENMIAYVLFEVADLLVRDTYAVSQELAKSVPFTEFINYSSKMNEYLFAELDFMQQEFAETLANALYESLSDFVTKGE